MPLQLLTFLYPGLTAERRLSRSFGEGEKAAGTSGLGEDCGKSRAYSIGA